MFCARNVVKNITPNLKEIKFNSDTQFSDVTTISYLPLSAIANTVSIFFGILKDLDFDGEWYIYDCTLIFLYKKVALRYLEINH